MANSNSRKLLMKILIYAILVVGIVAFCVFGVMYWIDGNVTLNIFAEERKLDFVDDDTEKYTLVNMEKLDTGEYKTISDDGYLIVEFDKEIHVKDLFINISFADSSYVYDSQIFYCGVEGKFSSAQSTGTRLYEGDNLISISEGNYKKIRFDFTNKKDMEFVVHSIKLYEDYISKSTLYIGVCIAILLCTIFGLFYFGLYNKIKFVKDIIEKWYNISEKNRCIVMLMFISTLTFLIVFLNIIYKGNIYAYRDIGSDTIMQYIPQYTLIVEKIRNGTLSMWLPEVGYGYNLAYFFMCDPLLLCTLFISAIIGSQHLPMLLMIYKLVGLLLCGYFAFKFLNFFTDNYKVVALVAYIYAFNGFAIVWGQHYLFYDYPLYAIIVFYFAEKYLQSKKYGFSLSLIVISFASMIYSVYMSYMIYLPLIFYVIIRYLQIVKKFKLKNFVVMMLNMGTNIIIGFVGGLSIGLAYISNLTNTGRVESESSGIVVFFDYLKKFYLEDDLFGSLQRFISSGLSGIGSNHSGLHNYYEEPQLFFTAIFWIIFLQFVFTIKKTSENKRVIVCKIIAIVLVGLAVYNKGVLYALYAFSQESRRTTFIIFPLLSIMFVLVLDNIFRKKILSKVGLVLGSAFSLYLLLYNMNEKITLEKKILILSSILVICTSVVVFILTLYKNSIKKIYIPFMVFVLLIFVNITTEMYISTNREGQVEKEWLYDTEKIRDTENAIEYIENLDNTYYRVEKNYSLWNGLTDNYFINYKPVSFYNSLMSSDTRNYVKTYMNPMYLVVSGNKPSFLYATNDIVQYSSLGLKYILSDYELPDYDYYELVNKIGEIYIYKNLVANSYTTFFDDVVLESEFNKLGYIDRNKVQQKALVIRDTDKEKFKEKIKSVKQLLEDFSESDITEEISINGESVDNILQEDIYEDKEFIFSEGWDSDLEGTAFLELSTFVLSDTIGKNRINIYFDCGEGYIYKNANPILCNSKNCQVRYPIPRGARKMLINFSSVPSCILELKIKDSKEEIKLVDNTSVLEEGKDSSHINGNVKCDREGVLFIPLTLDDNWKVTLNDKEVKKYEANSGFIAIEVPKGESNISVVYKFKELKYGAICLILAIILMSFYYIICKKTDKVTR